MVKNPFAIGLPGQEFVITDRAPLGGEVVPSWRPGGNFAGCKSYTGCCSMVSVGFPFLGYIAYGLL
jgi:hypothetical protein